MAALMFPPISIHILAELSLVQQNPIDGKNDKGDEDNRRNPEISESDRPCPDVGELGPESADRLCAQWRTVDIEGCRTPDHDHHAQRRDKGRNFQIGNNHTVDETDKQSGSDSDEDWENDRHGDEVREDPLGVVRTLDK